MINQIQKIPYLIPLSKPEALYSRDSWAWLPIVLDSLLLRHRLKITDCLLKPIGFFMPTRL